MNGVPMTPFRRAWLKWKTLKLPWRKRFLVGLDLQGNTYWEFHDALTAGRMRRLVEYPPSTHYSEIKITPQWHQWLRHTRTHPPSLTEQSQDLVRQQQLKVLAKRADERWAAKESYLDSPKTQQKLPAMATGDGGDYVVVGEVLKDVADVEGKGVENPVAGLDGTHSRNERTETTTKGTVPESSRSKNDKEKDDPWKRARGGPSEEWQPQAWSGSNVSRRA